MIVEHDVVGLETYDIHLCNKTLSHECCCFDAGFAAPPLILVTDELLASTQINSNKLCNPYQCHFGLNLLLALHSPHYKPETTT